MRSERFTSFDGTGIAYRRWAVTDDGGRPPVILHHGFAVDSELNWVATGVVDRLGADGFDVVTIDARGHGQSDKPHGSIWYGEDAMARDLSKLADHLGLEHFDVIGYSMGAIVALVAATQEPRIRRLVVGGVGAGVVELGGVDTRALPAEDLVDALLAEDPAQIPRPAMREFRAFADMAGADRLALAAHASVVRHGPLPYQDIRARSLVLAGDADPLADRPEVLASAIGAQLVIVPGDHLAAVAHPDFVSTASAFLADSD